MQKEREPSVDIVRRFKEDGAVPEDAVPVFSLSVLWFLDPDGLDHFVWKFDGAQRVSITIGDLEAIKHELLSQKCSCEHDEE